MDPSTRRRVAMVAATILAVSACTSSTGEAVPYAVELEAVCRQTTADLGALARPPEVTTEAFGNAIADVLSAEAERLRTLDPPTETETTHRDLVLITDDQVAAWRTLAAAAPDELAAVTERIASLSITRDDLAVDLGVQACVRTND